MKLLKAAKRLSKHNTADAKMRTAIDTAILALGSYNKLRENVRQLTEIYEDFDDIYEKGVYHGMARILREIDDTIKVIEVYNPSK